MNPAPALPPLDLLRQLFHYDPLAGTIVYLQQRGRRAAGEPAGATVRSAPRLYVSGGYHRAAAVAWALHHGADPSPLHVTPIDNDPFNLALSNLQLSESPYCRQRDRFRSAKRARGKQIKVTFYPGEYVWKAFHDKRCLGSFGTKAEAIAAKRFAMLQEEREKQEQQGGEGDA